jgi:hypothetical protein
MDMRYEGKSRQTIIYMEMKYEARFREAIAFMRYEAIRRAIARVGCAPMPKAIARMQYEAMLKAILKAIARMQYEAMLRAMLKAIAQMQYEAILQALDGGKPGTQLTDPVSIADAEAMKAMWEVFGWMKLETDGAHPERGGSHH